MKRKAKKRLAVLTAATVTATTLLGVYFPPVQAADTWVSDEDLADNETAAPTPDEVLPNLNQYNYQKEELAAFCHFGPNTFNEIEWGENYGQKTPDEIFRLEQDFQADSYVKALKDAGFHKLVVTAKHHDGFCIWASDYTTYDVASTSYKDGQGDILAEISEACTKYDIDMGLYLSPWDIHDPSYGYYDESGQATDADNDYLDYNDYYNNQLNEILGDPKYGNNGHFVEVWMDGAKGSGANAQEYDFKRWFTTIQEHEGEAAGYDADCMLFGAQAYTTVRWIGNENGYADKNTWSKSRVDYDANTIDSRSQGGYTLGWEDGNQWTVPEADARITSGWFWGTTKNTPKSIADLGSMYFGSVGHNSPLLLNIPPNNVGTVDQAILDRVAEFGENIRDTFANNLAAADGASVQADNVRGSDLTFKPGNTADGDDETYWTTDDGTNTGTLLIDLGGVKAFDVVSVEEAIQNGQRINEYQIEYRNANGEWNVLDSGETIGAKRLYRGGAVRGDQVKITVTAPDDKVPMISEVGVYKASEDFELTGAAPDGMDVIDIMDTNSFSFTGNWKNESGPNFIGGTNKWANAGATFTLSFEGTKVYLLGTKDPNHGTAKIYIDGELIETIDTNASPRALGEILFESGDLEDSTHTLKLEVESRAIGVEAAYVINNGGIGMIGIEESSYTMDEDSEMDVKLFRVGGTKGNVSVQVSPNPGSAIQDDFDTELITTVVFEEGQTEATAPVRTKRNENKTGDREFSIELTAQTDGLILGFNDRATVTILDTETSSKEALQELVNEGTAAEPEWYLSGWEEYFAAIEKGKGLLEIANASSDEITAMISEISSAKEDLIKREKYSADDPFAFPWKQGSSATLEAEFAELNDVVRPSDGQWSLRVSDAAWASNGKFVNCLNQEDTISFPYYAEKAGTYSFTAYYRSGDPKNALSWSEPDNKITAGTATAGASSAGETKEVTFDVEVTETGAGTLIFTGPDNKSPQLDKLEIVPKNVTLRQFTITAMAGENGTISDQGESSVTEGDNKEYTITPNEGYRIADVKVNGESVGVAETYTFENVSSDATIEAEFEFANYTDGNPFNFPTEAGGAAVTLEAEYSILNDVKLSSDGQWSLRVSDATWASNGKFINCLNQQDTISFPYYAEKAGTYSFTAYYRSGDSRNALSWSELDNKITEGQATAGANDSARETHEVTFNIEVTEAGAGTLVFTGPSNKSPQLDKFEIRLLETTEPDPEPEPTQNFTVSYTVESGNGTVSLDPTDGVVAEGESATVTFAPAEGYELGTVTVDGEEIQVTDNTYTMENVTADIQISVTFVRVSYTEEEPFYFPETVASSEPATLEAEYGVLNGSGVSIVEDAGASNGKYISGLDSQNTISIPYHAQKAGSYTVTVNYRSDVENPTLSWSEETGLVEPGSVTLGAQAETAVAAVVARSAAVRQTAADGFQQADFELQISGAGSGILNFAGPTTGSLDIDGFAITLSQETGTAQVDKTALTTAIETAEAEAAKTGTYTAESIAALNAAIEAARAVLNNDAATQQQVDEQVIFVNNAVTALAAIPTPERYPVTVTQPVNGNVTVSGPAQDGTVAVGETLTISVTANTGYVIGTLTVAGVEYPAAAGQTSYSFNVVATAEMAASGNIAVAAAFQAAPVNPGNPSGTGSQTGTGSQAGAANQTGTVNQAGVSAGNKAVQTGDQSSPMLWIVVLAAACAAGGAAIRLRTKKSGR